MIVKRMVRVSFLALICAAAASQVVEAQSAATRRETGSKKTITLSGVVGAQGKTFVDKDKRVWTVANPAALVAIDGKSVTVRAHATSPNEIVVSVVRLREERTTPKLDDVAFRR